MSLSNLQSIPQLIPAAEITGGIATSSLNSIIADGGAFQLLLHGLLNGGAVQPGAAPSALHTPGSLLTIQSLAGLSPEGAQPAPVAQTAQSTAAALTRELIRLNPQNAELLAQLGEQDGAVGSLQLLAQLYRAIEQQAIDWAQPLPMHVNGPGAAPQLSREGLLEKLRELLDAGVLDENSAVDFENTAVPLADVLQFLLNAPAAENYVMQVQPAASAGDDAPVGVVRPALQIQPASRQVEPVSGIMAVPGDFGLMEAIRAAQAQPVEQSGQQPLPQLNVQTDAVTPRREAAQILNARELLQQLRQGAELAGELLNAQANGRSAERPSAGLSALAALVKSFSGDRVQSDQTPALKIIQSLSGALKLQTIEVGQVRQLMQLAAASLNAPGARRAWNGALPAQLAAGVDEAGHAPDANQTAQPGLSAGEALPGKAKAAAGILPGAGFEQSLVQEPRSQQQQIIEQLKQQLNLQRLTNLEQRPLQLQLNPPELGRVQIQLELGRHAQLHTVFTVDSAVVRDALQANLGELRSALQGQGFGGAALDVQLSQQQQQREPTGRDAFDQLRPDADWRDLELAEQERPAAPVNEFVSGARVWGGRTRINIFA